VYAHFGLTAEALANLVLMHVGSERLSTAAGA
jgi:hypothetical protein